MRRMHRDVAARKIAGAEESAWLVLPTVSIEENRAAAVRQYCSPKLISALARLSKECEMAECVHCPVHRPFQNACCMVHASRRPNTRMGPWGSSQAPGQSLQACMPKTAVTGAHTPQQLAPSCPPYLPAYPPQGDTVFLCIPRHRQLNLLMCSIVLFRDSLSLRPACALTFMPYDGL